MVEGIPKKECGINRSLSRVFIALLCGPGVAGGASAR